MKKLLCLLIGTFMLSAGVCQTQQQPIQQKAKYFAEYIFNALDNYNNDAFDETYFYKSMQKIGEEMGRYINTLNEQQGEEFGREFAVKVYEYSEKYGYGEEFAESFLKSFVTALEQKE